MRAAREAIEPLFKKTNLDFRMAWVFIDMMKEDTTETAAEAAARIPDSRVAAFHDSNHVLGRAMARRLGWKQHVAWDTYCIYNPGTLWSGTEPVPDAWFHQLKEVDKSEADPAQFRTGDDLRVALETSLKHAAAQPLPAHYLTST